MSGQFFSFRFWNEPHRLHRMSQQVRIRTAHGYPTPGHKYDTTGRGQPGRFDKWLKLPKAAHRLFWRTHQ